MQYDHAWGVWATASPRQSANLLMNMNFKLSSYIFTLSALRNPPKS